PHPLPSPCRRRRAVRDRRRRRSRRRERRRAPDDALRAMVVVRPLVSALLVAAAVALEARAAPAYVRTTTAHGTPVEWRTRQPSFVLADAPDAPIARDRFAAALRSALGSWNGALDGCSRLRASFTNDDGGPRAVAADGRSMVLWRLSGYCDDPANADDDLCL